MPRFSVLLPTHNGASLLEGCVRSVLDQPSEDFELIISDNASTDETPELLQGFAADPRVRLLRQDPVLGVTDNWNAALAASTGERIVLLGDDDALMPDYFERASALLDEHSEPDVLLHNGYGFAFPGFAGSEVSNYADPFYEPGPLLPAAGDVPLSARRQVVEQLFDFQFPLPLNMQNAIVHRRCLAHFPGELFKPPFPDFYALAGLMLTVDRWTMSPERLVVIGVSPKSFGQTVHSATSVDKARDYLKIDARFAGHLPGSEVMNGHYETLQVIQADFGHLLPGIEISRPEYVWQQMYSWYVQRRLGSLSTRDVGRRMRLLDARDWAGVGRLFLKRLNPAAVRRRVRLGGETAVTTLWPGMRPVPEVSDIVGFREWAYARRSSSGRATA